MKPGEVGYLTPNPGRGWGPVRSVARSVARRGLGLPCVADPSCSHQTYFTIHPIKNRRCTGTGRTRPRRTRARRGTEHSFERPGAGPRPRPGPPAREPRTVGTVPRAWRVSRSLALPERVYTQATPACQLSTIVQKTSTIPICSDEQRQRLISKPGSQSRSPGREPKSARSRACLTLLW